MTIDWLVVIRLVAVGILALAASAVVAQPAPAAPGDGAVQFYECVSDRATRMAPAINVTATEIAEAAIIMCDDKSKAMRKEMMDQLGMKMDATEKMVEFAEKRARRWAIASVAAARMPSKK